MANRYDEQLFLEALANAGLPVTCYSGKGMDGKLCCAITTAKPFETGVRVGRALAELGVQEYPDSETAPLGGVTVVFWRDLKWSDDYQEV